jgi:hypothetical protein
MLYLIYFIIIFVCRALRPPDIDRRPFLRLCTTRVSRSWAELEAAQQEASEEPNVGVTQQEALEKLDVEDEADDQPQATYRLVHF